MAVPLMTTVSTVLPRQAALGAVMSKELAAKLAFVLAQVSNPVDMCWVGSTAPLQCACLWLSFRHSARMVMPRYL